MRTGDAFIRDADGDFSVNRIEDAIRRRDENISSFEVEAEVVAHPDMQEAAVIAVPGEYGEDTCRSASPRWKAARSTPPP